MRRPTSAARWAGSASLVRRGMAVPVGTALALGLTSCSDDPPEPEPVADAVAAALESGDFDAVPLAEGTPDAVESEFEEIVEGMSGAPWTVSVRALVPEEDDGVYTATFDVVWRPASAGDGAADEADDDAHDDADADEADDGDIESDEADGSNDGDAGETVDADDVTWAYTTTAQLTLVDGDDGAYWQTAWSPALLHPDLSAGDRLRMRRESADRADIIGAGGVEVVTERDVYRVGIDKTTFDDDATEDDMASAALALADVVGVNGEGLRDRVLASGERAFVEAITLRSDAIADVREEVNGIDGAVAIPGTLPLAPTREFARPILGTVGEATAEIIEESNGLIEAGDTVGLSGLQRRYDTMLRGTPGVTVEIVPAEGDPETVFENDAVPGEDLVTTLDVDLQMTAESILADVEPASAIVAIQPSTGHVLAAASGPGGEGYSTATLGQYAPGSTFKVATALALLRAGMDPGSRVDCPPTLTVDGREFGNYSEYPDSALGEISLTTAVAESCNTALMGERDRVSQQDLADAAAALGLGFDDDLGLAAFMGSVPTEADGTAHAASMIGQGQMLASPLAMATVAASVVAGEVVTPVIIDQPDAGTPDPERESATPVDSGEAEQLREMMRAAVESGSATFLQNVPGEPVGAKTGTAEYGSGDDAGTHAWMIAFQGDLAVAVFVEEGESGSRTAGPLLQEFLSQ